MLQSVKTKSNNIIISEKEGISFKGTKQYLGNRSKIRNFKCHDKFFIFSLTYK